MLLQAQKIHCKRNSRNLFHDISFAVKAGELLQIVGNNGVGKSSLLRILAGLLQPESGDIFWNHQPILQSDFHRHLFYAGHSLAIKSELTIAENLNSKNEVKQVLSEWSLDKFQNQLCGTLSQGQKQRVALARLQLSNTKIWILDEPFANLDAAGILQLEKLLQSHLNIGGIIIISTHRQIEIESTILNLNPM